jgi:membrane fusion protein, copper/silver efflux system
MKKSLYAALFVIVLAASFWAGAWYNSRKTSNIDASGVEKAAVNSDVSPDTFAEDEIDSSSLPFGTVMISPEKRQMTGVRTGVAEKSAITKKLRFLGRVEADETRIFKVKAAVDGIIREVYPGTTGSMVKKGQPLASYYSPDIYAAEQGYLIAVSSDRHRSNLQVQVNESRLLYLGMSSSQIDELRKKGEILENIVLQSPATGFVFGREVAPELRFQKGEELYRIAALDRVWIIADIYESEARYFRPNATALVSHPQLTRELRARVSNVLPLFDAASRTLKVRLEAVNPGFILRPDMFVDVDLPIKMPPAIVVPSDAIIFSGIKKTIFVDLGDGYFEPREVQTGWRIGNTVEITGGLKPGERFAIFGAFLIDSESKLRESGLGSPQTPVPEKSAGSGR